MKGLSNIKTENAANEIRETNHNNIQKFWRGTQAEYNALTETADDTQYIITDAEMDDDIIIDGNTETNYNGILKGNGDNVVVATAGTDYVAPVTGKGLSTNDLTDELESHYDDAYTHSQSQHAPVDAEKNVNADWDSDSGDSQILNKPSVFPPSQHNHTKLEITDLGTIVSKFNNRTGDVTPQNGDYTAEMVGADASGVAETKVSEHDASSTAHSSLFEGKVSVVEGKGLSTNDYTTTEKNKLSSLNTIVLIATSISVSTWSSDSTYTGYTYRASIPITGMTADYIPDVTFSATDATSGNYAPVADSYDGGIYIYSKVNTAITVPSAKGVKAI